MNILIIDNDTIDRLIISKTLRDSGFDILTLFQVESIQEGLLRAEEERMDVVLCNYEVALYYGLGVVKVFRRMGHFLTSVIMISASNDEQFALRSLEAGAHDFIVKGDISSERLKRIIRVAIERTKLEQQVREGQAELRRLAEQDSLTGLGNRFYFDKTLKKLIKKSMKHNEAFVLLLLDLDKFKNINDSLGHVVGDNLLKKVARRLCTAIRVEDALCRLGGDEFAILMPNVRNSGQTRLKLQRIFECLNEPIQVNNASINISVSIGIADFPRSANEADELLKCADVAMYRAKAVGVNRFQYYSKTVHDIIQKKIRIENDLRNAISENQLLLYYQPQLSGSDFKFVGVEALIRWQHPEFGLIAPDDFIPIAEETGLIHEIGRWVFLTAVQQYSHWKKMFPQQCMDLIMSTNISAREIKQHGLAKYIQETLDEYGMPSSDLEIELTESCLDRSQVAIDFLQNISDMGIKLSLDDFGTGYSNLSHIMEFPIKVVKLDQSFLRDSGQEKKRNLIQAISLFARSLEYETVVEGIETHAHKQLCVDLGVDRLQGFFISKPLPPEDIEAKWFIEEVPYRSSEK